jgi:hypothetical protein
MMKFLEKVKNILLDTRTMQTIWGVLAVFFFAFAGGMYLAGAGGLSGHALVGGVVCAVGFVFNYTLNSELQ